MKSIFYFFLVMSFSQICVSAQSNMVVIDKSINEYEVILDCIDLEAEVILLDESSNQLELLTDKLAGYENLDAMYLFTCGEDGIISFNGSNITSGSLNEKIELLSRWHLSFNDNADLMIYTCNLAKTNKGRGLIRRLSAYTGLDVAASVNSTGNANTDCDWDLEFRKGKIEAQNCLNKKSIQKYPGKFSRVNEIKK